MEDRYLYKAKGDKRYNDRSWYEGYLIKDKDGDYQIYKNCTYRTVMKDTICQCTGLKDKNGKLIWENDVVKAWSQGTCAKGKIKHRIDGTWIMYPAWQNGEMWYLLPNENGDTTVEVIGNIFDNPELLEK